MSREIYLLGAYDVRIIGSFRVPASETGTAYEAPRVETVLGTTDLEREVMHGIISQQG